MSKNFGLTENEFTEMCLKLRRGDEGLFEKVFLAHFEDCIVYLINNYSINREDAYDSTMETLIVFRRRLIDGKVSYGNIRYLFTKMATQIFLKSKKKLDRVEGLEIEAESNIDEADLQVLEKSINELGKDCQELLKLNFYEKMTIADIALMKNKKASSLRKTKQRCLSKLKQLFTKYNH